MNKTLKNMSWRFAERSGAQIVSFVVSIVLARLLAPDVYGTVALITVFTNILQVFIDSGLGNALIQKEDADDLDFSTVFYFNFVVCVALYLLICVCAPFIAEFYNDNSLIPVIRVLSFTLVISGIKNIQQAYISKNMLFKKFFFSTIIGTIFSAVVGITLAYIGFGVWALVAQQMVNRITDTIILWYTVKWRPKLQFSLSRLRDLFEFGSKLLAASLLNTIYTNLRQLIIGKVYSTTDLSFYNKGRQIPNLAINNLNTSIDSVLFPLMSKSQKNEQKVKDLTRKSVQLSSYVIWPVMIGLAVCAESIITILLGEVWLLCVPYMRIFCITFAFYPIHTANLNAIKAVGRSDIFLKLEVIKKIIGISSILISIKFGPIAIALSGMIVTPISALINSYPNRKLLNYTFMEQLFDMVPPMLLSLFMGVCVWNIQFLMNSTVGILSMQVFAGISIYVLGSVIFRFSGFLYILTVFKGLKLRK